MARRNADETRRLILDAGLHMLLERGASAGVQHIRLQEVLRNVGLTTGAAYRIWADQTEFHRDLSVEMVGLRFAAPTASAQGAVRDFVEGEGTMDDTIRAAAADHVAYASQFHRAPESRASHAFITALSLRTAAGAWPELREASAARHAESIDDFVAFYTAMMQRYNLRLRTPYTIREFAESMAALGEGFAIRAAEGLDHPIVEISDADEGPAGRWTLFGVAARGLVDAFMTTDPAPDDDKQPSPGRQR